MTKVTPKKYLGQHFLKEEGTASLIADSLLTFNHYSKVLEIGPGTGILTKHLLNRSDIDLYAVEIDEESVNYLHHKYKQLGNKLFHNNFLKVDWASQFNMPFGIIGNFPYNISSQIFFKVLELHHLVMEVVCMLQKEVATRIISKPGSKSYGILSVLLQAYYNTEWVLDVPPTAFYPPPKVDSSVIRLSRNSTKKLPCSENLFFRLVKQAFQNRRKTLRNALKPINLPPDIQQLPVMSRRAEQLTVDDYISLTSLIEQH